MELEAEQEAIIRERLQAGIDVKEILPYRYYKNRLYYEIHFHYGKVKVIFLLERHSTNPDEKLIKFRIVEFFKFIQGKKQVISSSLMYARLILEPSKPLYKRYVRTNTFSLSGKLYLPANSTTKEHF